MAEGQNKRQIGKGMKPRGKTRVKPQKEAKEVTAQSTTEGQLLPAEVAVLEVQEGNETPGNLEPENGGKSLQNLENSEPIVAHDEGLEAALKESGEGSEPPKEFVEALKGFVESRKEPSEFAYNGSGADLETAIAVGTGTVKDLHGGVKEAFFKSDGDVVDAEGKFLAKVIEPQAPMGGKTYPFVGPQPDGSEKFIIKVEEGYVEAVKQWAESDGILVEDWLSNALYSYISTYGEPAKGR